MMHSLREILKYRCLVRNISTSCSRLQTAEPLSIPVADGQPISVTPKIEKIVNEISKLNLVEVSELNTTLKRVLNLPDAPVFMGGVASATAAVEEDDGPKMVKTSYSIKLDKFDDGKKVALIKEVKSLMEDMNLVQAKKFVESAPVIVKADLGKDEAEKIKETLEKVGGVCVIL